MSHKIPASQIRLLQHIIDACPIPMAINDEQTNITHLNATFITTFGYNSQELTRLSDWWPKAYPNANYRIHITEMWHTRLEASIQNQYPFDPLQVDITCKNGTIKTVLASASRLTHDYLGLHLVVLFDISQQIVAQKSVEAARQLLYSIIENLPVRVFWKDLDSRYLGCNTQFARDAGLANPEQIIGKHDFDMTWRNQAELYRQDDLLVMRDGLQKLGYEEPQTTPEGQMLWLRTSKVPLKSMDQETIGVLGIYEDITQQKRTELKYQTILNTIRDGFLLTDLQGNVLEANQAYCDMVGYSSDEIKTMKVWQIEIIDDESAVKNRIQNIMQLGYDRFETQHRHKNGAIIYVEISVSVDQSNPNHFIAFVHDISARKQSERREQSRQHILELMSSNTYVSQLLNEIAKSITELQPQLACAIIINDEANKQFCYNNQHPSIAQYLHELQIAPELTELNCCTAGLSGERRITEVPPHQPSKSPHRTCISEPIFSLNQEQVLGVLALDHEKDYVLTNADLKLIEQTAALASMAIEQAQTYHELSLANMVYQHSSEAMMVTDADGMIINVNPAFAKLTGYTLEEVKGQKTNILQSGKQDQHFYEAMWASLTNTGTWCGEIWNKRKSGEVFAEWLTINTIFNDQGKPFRRVALFDDITKHKEQEAMIWQQANYDPLTGLANRNLFSNYLNQAITKTNRNQQSLALFFIDMDHFKEINDTQGHDVGDLLLKEVASRLVSIVPKGFTIARLGGDEFTVLIEGVTQKNALNELAEEMLNLLAKPYMILQHQHFISASIGIALYPNDALNAIELLKNADQAMYSAKNLGRNRFDYFTSTLQQVADTRYQLINQMHTALDRNQFYLAYQPIIELATGRIEKAEALIRWQHPSQGLISPADFIPLAEETGIILQIGQWVFETAIGQTQSWRSIEPRFQLSINASPIQLQRDTKLASKWIQQLAAADLPGDAMTIEITEGLLVDINEDVQQQLADFQYAGVPLSLDDFGTGYSSLSYLKKFDIDFLKIDQSFIRNLTTDNNDRTLCEAIIIMAHKLGLKVIAEGIETEAQANILLDMDCDYGQGYYFAKPLSADEFTKKLTQQQSVAPLTH